MTPEEQRIAIAEACGWTVKRWTDGEGNSVVGLLPPGVEKTSSSFRHSPDYLNDLNAMHEAEGMLLAKCGNDPQDDLWVDYLANLLMAAPLCLREHATAAQRAEAFLKTIGKWEDSQ
jgi:hypothetical protein